MDNCTRWSSTHKMIHRAEELKYQIITWCAEEGIAESDQISQAEWLEIKNFDKALNIFSDLSTFTQGQTYPTIQCSISTYNHLFDALDDMREAYPDYQPLTQAFQKLKKYYELSDDCPANFISSVLNPNQKLIYFYTNGFETEEISNIKQLFALYFKFI